MVSDLVRDIVDKVFPIGTEVRIGGKADPKSSRFWMVTGSSKEPRWILPYEKKHADPFLLPWTPYAIRSRLKWHFLMCAYKWKWLGRLPGIVPLQIHIPPGNPWNHLGWSLPRPPVPVIYIGTPGPDRKVVLGLVDPQTNKVISVGKSPLGPNGRVSINYEAEVLDTLQSEKPGRAPRSLFIDHRKGISTQEFIEGMPTGRKMTERHVTWLTDMVIPEESFSLREFAAQLNEQIQALEEIDSESRFLLEQVIAEADDPSPIPKVWEHGDFAPWNIKIAEDGSLRAVDWEYASRKGLPLFDFIFFSSMQAFLFREKTLFPPNAAHHLYNYLDKLGIPREKAKAIIQVCMVRDWLRCQKTSDRPRADFLMGMLAALPGEMP